MNGRHGVLRQVSETTSSSPTGYNLLRIAKATDNVVLPDGTSMVLTASRSTVFAEMIRSMRRDGPLATGAAFLAVVAVVLVATHNLRGCIVVLDVALR